MEAIRQNDRASYNVFFGAAGALAGFTALGNGFRVKIQPVASFAMCAGAAYITAWITSFIYDKFTGH